MHRGRSYNPRDGIEWLCRLVESPDELRLEGRTDAICVRDVVELRDESRGMDVTHGGRWRTVLSTGTTAGGLRQSHVM